MNIAVTHGRTWDDIIVKKKKKNAMMNLIRTIFGPFRFIPGKITAQHTFYSNRSVKSM